MTGVSYAGSCIGSVPFLNEGSSKSYGSGLRYTLAGCYLGPKGCRSSCSTRNKEFGIWRVSPETDDAKWLAHGEILNPKPKTLSL